jgi:hypothetical protein
MRIMPLGDETNHWNGKVRNDIKKDKVDLCKNKREREEH